MSKYLMIWELNQNLIPVDPKERGAGYSLLMGLVRKDIEKGVTKDWGSFIGEKAGFCIVEGSEVTVLKMVQQYSPYVNFKTHAVASEEQVCEMVKSMTD